MTVFAELTDELLDLTAVEQGRTPLLFAKCEWMSCCCCCCLCSG
jgi:hypothetical protein